MGASKFKFNAPAKNVVATGAFAFHYPNNDVPDVGRPTPVAGPNAMTPLFGSGRPGHPEPADTHSTARLKLTGKSG
jgi:hypothetical protein